MSCSDDELSDAVIYMVDAAQRAAGFVRPVSNQSSSPDHQALEIAPYCQGYLPHEH